jgi:O-succinylbenzoic acid--CoA ligase
VDAASLLRRVGAAPDRPLAVITHDARLICRLAEIAATLGKPLFPLDPALPAATLQSLLAQAHPDVAVSEFDVPGCRTVACSDISAAQTMAPDTHYPPARRIALLIATSGSSGQPKAVMLTHANLDASARCSASRTPLRPGDRWLICLPLFHIGGFAILSRCARAGATAVPHCRFDAEEVLASLRREQISHLSLVPTMLAQLLDASSAPPPAALRHVLVGGSTLLPTLADRARNLGWPIQPTYGMSETASQVATLATLPRGWRAGNVGTPLPGLEVALDSRQRLKVRGPVVMAGYANPDLTPGDGLEEGWFVTPDLAEISPEGNLTIVGRADHAIMTGGKKVHPAEIEKALSQCPGVVDVMVTGTPEPEWGETVTALFRGPSCEQGLLAWAREHLPSSWRPRAAFRVMTLPQLSNGKPDRSRLRILAARLAAEAGATGKPQFAGDDLGG